MDKLEAEEFIDSFFKEEQVVVKCKKEKTSPLEEIRYTLENKLNRVNEKSIINTKIN